MCGQQLLADLAMPFSLGMGRRDWEQLGELMGSVAEDGVPDH